MATTTGSDYHHKLRSARDAADLLRVQDTVAVPIATGQPAAFLAAARDPERLAIAEVVHDMPHVFGLGQYGGHRIHVSEVDCVIESDRSAFVLPD